MCAFAQTVYDRQDVMYENDARPWEGLTTPNVMPWDEPTVEIDRQLLLQYHLDVTGILLKSKPSYLSAAEFHKKLKANIFATQHRYPERCRLSHVTTLTPLPRKGLSLFRQPQFTPRKLLSPTWVLFFDQSNGFHYAIVIIDDLPSIATGHGTSDQPFVVMNSKEYKTMIANAPPWTNEPRLRDKILHYTYNYGGILPAARTH